MEPNKLGEILERLEPTELEIQVPKMKVESTIGIQQALEKVGRACRYVLNQTNMMQYEFD